MGRGDGITRFAVCPDFAPRKVTAGIAPTAFTSSRGHVVTRTLLFVLVAFGLSGAAGAERQKLQGVWRPVKLERGGQTVADGALPGARFVVKEDALLFKVRDVTLLDVRFRLNPGKTPAEIDLTSVAGPSQGQTVRGIYRLDGKRL